MNAAKSNETTVATSTRSIGVGGSKNSRVNISGKIISFNFVEWKLIYTSTLAHIMQLKKHVCTAGKADNTKFILTFALHVTHNLWY